MRAPVGDADLRLDEVDAGDALGHGVLDLDARIHLDEVEVAGVGVLQELHRAGVAVVGGARRSAAPPSHSCGALRLVEEQRRGTLDHLLVAPLHGAVALEQVHEVAVRVAEHLHLDVARAAHQLLEIHLVVAEAGLRLAARHRQQLARAAHRSR